MRAGTEISVGLGLLLALQLLTSFSAIGLMGRSSPIVGEMMRNNADSQEAAEEMLSILAAATGPIEGQARQDFLSALSRADQNVTEMGEEGLLRALKASAPEALEGVPVARVDMARDLQQLCTINRHSMREVETEVHLLSSAGGWASALLGVASLLISALVYRRIRALLVLPILEMDQALEAVRGGDSLRRLARHEGTGETDRLSANVNWLLDQRALGTPANCSPAPAPESPLPRAALLALLDRQPHPAALLQPQRPPVAMNQACLDAWTDPIGLLREVAARLPEALGSWTVTPLEGGYLCEHPPVATAPAPQGPAAHTWTEEVIGPAELDELRREPTEEG